MAIVVGLTMAGVGVVGQLGAGGNAGENDGTAAGRTTTTTTPATTTTTRAHAVEAFVPQLVAAIRAGDNSFKFDRLHPAVIERYGEATCREGLSGPQPGFEMTVAAVGTPEPWDWVTDGQSRTIPQTIPVNVKRTGAGGVTVDAVIHVAEAEGDIRWFTDCGTPLSS